MYILTKFLNYLNIYTINNNVFNNAVNDIFNNNNDHHINYLESGLFYYYYYKIGLDDIEKGLFNYNNITITEKNIF